MARYKTVQATNEQLLWVQQDKFKDSYSTVENLPSAIIYAVEVINEVYEPINNNARSSNGKVTWHHIHYCVN